MNLKNFGNLSLINKWLICNMIVFAISNDAKNMNGCFNEYSCYVVGENSSELVSLPSDGACIKGSNRPTFKAPVCCGESVDAKDNDDCELDREDELEWLPLLSTEVENVSGIIAGLLYFFADSGDMLTGWAAPGWDGSMRCDGGLERVQTIASDNIRD